MASSTEETANELGLDDSPLTIKVDQNGERHHLLW